MLVFPRIWLKAQISAIKRLRPTTCLTSFVQFYFLNVFKKFVKLIQIKV